MENQIKLSKMGLQELTPYEMEEVKGGNPLLLVVVGVVLAGVVSDWSGFKQGFSEA